MVLFFRTHTWTLVTSDWYHPGVSIPHNNIALSQECLKFNCLRLTVFHDRGVYNSIGTIHTGLNTRRALREMFTLGWLVTTLRATLKEVLQTYFTVQDKKPTFSEKSFQIQCQEASPVICIFQLIWSPLILLLLSTHFSPKAICDIP